MNLLEREVKNFKLSLNDIYIGVQTENNIYIYEQINEDRIDLVSTIESEEKIIDFDFPRNSSSEIIYVLLREKAEDYKFQSLLRRENFKDNKILNEINFDERDGVSRVTSISTYINNLILIGFLPEPPYEGKKMIKVLNLELHEDRNASVAQFPFAEGNETEHYEIYFPNKILYNSKSDLIIVMGYYAGFVMNSERIIWHDMSHEYTTPGGLVTTGNSYKDSEMIAYSENNSILAILFTGNIGDLSPKVYLYDLENQKEKGWFCSGFDYVEQIVLSAEGKYLAAIVKEESIYSVSIINTENRETFQIKNFTGFAFSNKIDSKLYLFHENSIHVIYPH